MILLLLLLITSTKYAISQISNNKNTGTPPILLIKDENYRFDPGSAAITSAMLNYITNKIVPDIEKTTKDFNINTVEIIGHTDEQTIGSLTLPGLPCAGILGSQAELAQADLRHS